MFHPEPHLHVIPAALTAADQREQTRCDVRLSTPLNIQRTEEYHERLINPEETKKK